MSALAGLITLSHALGREDRGLAILGEGNTSTRLAAGRFLVKASGSSLGVLREEDVVECDSAALFELFDREVTTDAEIDAALRACRVNFDAKKPSVEALFHGYLLSLPGIHFVGHTHPIHANGLLCSPLGRSLADDRIFPDEIVCCAGRSVWVAYVDPGLVLARAIKAGVEEYLADVGEPPRVILLQNHGVITLGGTPQAVEAAMLMVEKAARIRLAALATGGINAMTPDQVHRIANRSDEHERRRMLKI